MNKMVQYFNMKSKAILNQQFFLAWDKENDLRLLQRIHAECPKDDQMKYKRVKHLASSWEQVFSLDEFPFD